MSSRIAILLLLLTPLLAGCLSPGAPSAVDGAEAGLAPASAAFETNVTTLSGQITAGVSAWMLPDAWGAFYGQVEGAFDVPHPNATIEINLTWTGPPSLGVALSVFDPEGNWWYVEPSDGVTSLVVSPAGSAGEWTINARPMGPVVATVWEAEVRVTAPHVSE